MTTYWFRPKRYGYGATPVTWQGWALTLAVPAILVLSIVAMNRFVGRSDGFAWFVWACFVAALVSGFVWLSRARTDGEWGWRWGAGRN
ncbi:MAG: hypothetical protein ACTHLO_10065 [Pseudolabrys sp.]